VRTSFDFSIRGTDLHKAHLIETNLSVAILSGACINRGAIDVAIITGADLRDLEIMSDISG
jgi:uncharacterized protein YjbI with pentapeptide repeats